MQARQDLRRTGSSIAATSVVFIMAIMFIGLTGGRRAHAQSADAEGLFDAGNSLMAEGKLAQACDAFQASNGVEPRAGTLIRLGECREQNQQLASAWSAYKDALTRVKDPSKRDIATARAGALEARLSYLTVSVSEDSRVDGLTLTRNGKPFDPGLWNRALPLDGGDYIIAGRAPGHEEWQTTAHVAVEGAKVSVEVPTFKELSKLMSSPALLPGAERSDPETVRSTAVFTTRRKIAIGVGAASVVGVIAGVGFGASGNGIRNDAFKLCPHPAMPCAHADQSNALLKSAHSRALAANVAFGVAAAAALGAGALWFTGAPDAEHPSRVSVVPSVGPGETGVIFMGRF